MQYLCLICAENMLEQMESSAAAEHMEEYRVFLCDLQRSGHLISCNRLVPPTEGVTVRVRSGELQVTDGPFAETKEQLGGYLLIEAKDLNEAIQIAARIPCAPVGSIEVRALASDPLTLATLSAGAVEVR